VGEEISLLKKRLDLKKKFSLEQKLFKRKKETVGKRGKGGENDLGEGYTLQGKEKKTRRGKEGSYTEKRAHSLVSGGGSLMKGK